MYSRGYGEYSETLTLLLIGYVGRARAVVNPSVSVPVPQFFSLPLHAFLLKSFVIDRPNICILAHICSLPLPTNFSNMSTHELKQMAPPVLSEMEGQPIYRDKDDVYLTRMGKRPVLKVKLP